MTTWQAAWLIRLGEHLDTAKHHLSAVRLPNLAEEAYSDTFVHARTCSKGSVLELRHGCVRTGLDLNLHQLYKAVQSHGGFEATISNKCWGKVATKLGIDKSTHTNASFVLK